MTLSEVYTAIASTGIYTVQELVKATYVSILNDTKLHFEMPWYDSETIDESILNGVYELPNYLLVWNMRRYSSLVEGIENEEEYNSRVATVSASRKVDKIVSIENGVVKILRFDGSKRVKAKQSQTNPFTTNQTKQYSTPHMQLSKM